MRHWQIHGIAFSLPEGAVTPTIARMCDKGWYEDAERRALEAHLRPGDRLLELGGGAGFLACLAARRLGPAAVCTVEANPEMLPVIAANLAANGQDGVTVHHGAALPGPDGRITLNIPPAFWAATVGAVEEARPVEVPRLSVEGLLTHHDPSVLVIDVEGAETAFFEDALPAALRVIVLELHPQHYPPDTIAEIFRRLDARGFAYDPTGSSGAVVCFSRLPS